MKMFCYQCQEASGGKGCTVNGICGIKADVANLQDLLIYNLKGLAYWQTKARNLDLQQSEISHYIIKILFATITNANFDLDWALIKLAEGLKLKEDMKSLFLKEFSKKNNEEFSENIPEAANWNEEVNIESLNHLTEKGYAVNQNAIANEDIRALISLVLYGLKGIAAYADHALPLGYENTEIWKFIESALATMLRTDLTIDELLKLVDDTGAFGVKVMALLDQANTTTYGHPEPTDVNLGVGNKPAILITGHDLLDLYELLQQTEKEGIDIYTHGEMLPANAYPGLKKFKHLVGNYGGSWWHQTKEFESFNGPILFTTNCLVPPKKSYKDRVFVTGNVAFPGTKRIAEREDGNPKDFSAIIKMAKKLNPPIELETGTIPIGFAHNSVLSVADKIVDAIKSGAIKRFVVMAGCDGRMKSRNYYTDVAEKLPKETIILTAGCAKFRYNKLNLGDIGGIPRVLDAGQCNDSYSLAVIALKLKEVFEMDSINDLPLSFDIAWYEQKAVIVLLALLHLGVKNIRLGPTLPSFLSPNVAKIIIETFGLKGITTAETDVAAIMTGQ
ncbi:Hydroxylamine reductase [Candidatus Lokiarchaeum ossiferum]|uniref:Hydroxylamine reductase n=1 Tax=Candidatus Lokiarchaeum ossiferum TaxID=2951803 RepID=A0ABY6HKM9_9ARCH|nr:Hydroxylamine reductase [Candidatus Lokiarchaeum sp. B-35]